MAITLHQSIICWKGEVNTVKMYTFDQKKKNQTNKKNIRCLHFIHSGMLQFVNDSFSASCLILRIKLPKI